MYPIPLCCSENVSWCDSMLKVCNVAEAEKMLPAFRNVRLVFFSSSFFAIEFAFCKCTVRLQNMQSEAIGKAVQIRIIKNHFNLLHISWFCVWMSECVCFFNAAFTWMRRHGIGKEEIYTLNSPITRTYEWCERRMKLLPQSCVSIKALCILLSV